MLRSLTSGVSGLQNFQEEMDVIGNNIANVNTTAFKSARTEFADTFSDTLRQSTAGTATASGATAIQVGTGVTTSAITNNFDEGVMNRTGIDSDLMIQGNGFFVVRDTVSNVNYVTRAGNFHVDNNGYLLTATGERVQGLSDAGLTTSGDIQIDATGKPSTSDPASTMLSWTVNSTGQIIVKLSDGTSFVRGQILMQNFMNPNALEKQGNNLYAGQSAAGPIGNMSPAGTNGLGSIQGGALELSNVDLANEMANLITAQRAFEANAKIITTSDEMLQVVVNVKR